MGKEMKAYVINLDRSPDRLAHFKERWAEIVGETIELEVFNGFDSKDLTVPWWWKSSLGAFGCYMSHYMLAAKILQSNPQEPVFIFEDDALLGDDFMTKLPAAIAEAERHKVDLFYLGGASRSKDKSVERHIKIGSQVIGAYAYVIFPKYVKAYYESMARAPLHPNSHHSYHGDVRMKQENSRSIQAKPMRWLVGCIEGISTITNKFREGREV